MRRPLTASFLLSWLLPAMAGANEAPQPAQDQLKLLSIEELMRVDVTTATRSPEPIGTTAAAISIISGDDIRRAGVTTIADALLLADGVHVARFNNGTWAISARGFNQNTSNKLLVMVDGRTVYSPLFTGVFWNTLDYVLEDIDRIEVIRGPGATLWGANAVNGVVNIITRHSRDTQGTLVNVAAGSEDRGIVEVRHGGLAGASASWRLYGKFAHRDAQRFSTGGSSGDARSRGQAGLRMDGGSADATSWMLKADAFQSDDRFPDRANGEFSELSLQGRWSRVVSPASRVDLQTYYRREYRRVPGQLTHHINVFDADGQHAVTVFGRHDVVWGGGARINRDRADGVTVLFDPVERTYPLVNVFAQDEFPLVSDNLSVTLGVKVERNAFSGAEVQPNVRARLLLPHSQVLWGAVSRAVRRPTRFETDTAFLGPGGLVLFRGNEDFRAESLVATEAGYRVLPDARLSVDATLFLHRYTDLRSQDAPPGGGLPILIGNSLRGESHGIELALTVQPRTWWRTHVGYTWLGGSIERQTGSRDVGGGVSERNDPEHLLGVRTSVDLPGNVEVDALLRHVAALPDPPVPAFSELNLRAGWRVTPRAELAVTGQDLLHDRHAEFGAPVPRRVEFERSILASLTLRF